MTVSAARSPQEEADDAFANPEPTPTSDSLDDGPGDTIWLCTGSGSAGDCDDAERVPARQGRQRRARRRERPRARAHVRRDGSSATGWDDEQWVVRLRGRRPALRGRPRRRRPALDDLGRPELRRRRTSATSRSALRDNDTPGVYVTAGRARHVRRGQADARHRGRPLRPARRWRAGDVDPAVGAPSLHRPQRRAARPARRRIPAGVDDPGQARARRRRASRHDRSSTSRRPAASSGTRSTHPTNPLLTFTYYTIDFDTHELGRRRCVVNASMRAATTAAPRGPADRRHHASSATSDVDHLDYARRRRERRRQRRRLRRRPTVEPTSSRTSAPAPASPPSTVIDDETADVVTIESGVDTVVAEVRQRAVHDRRPDRRLHDPPDQAAGGLDDDAHSTPVDVEVAILTDGLVDVHRRSAAYADRRRRRATQVDRRPTSRRSVFLGNVTSSAERATLTRANGSDLGSFIDEGFQRGDLIRVDIDGRRRWRRDDRRHADASPTHAHARPTALAGRAARPRRRCDDDRHGSARSRARASWTGARHVRPSRDALGGWQADPRATTASWLADGFLEGQWVEVCADGAARALRRAASRSRSSAATTRRRTTSSSSARLERRRLPPCARRTLAGARRRPSPSRRDRRRRDTSTTTELVPRADDRPRRPTSTTSCRSAAQGVKIFPVSTHVLSKLQGPLAVEGGVTGADRSLQLGAQAAGREATARCSRSARSRPSRSRSTSSTSSTTAVQAGPHRAR